MNEGKAYIRNKDNVIFVYFVYKSNFLNIWVHNERINFSSIVDTYWEYYDYKLL